MNTFLSILEQVTLPRYIHVAVVITCLTIYASTTPLLLYLLFGLYACCFIISAQQKQHTFMSLTLCMAACSILAIQRVNNQYSNYHTSKQLLNQRVTVEGPITQITSTALHKNQTTIFVQTSCITHNKTKQPISKKIALFIPTSSITFYENQIIKIHNCKLNQPCNKEYERYLIKENIWSIAHSKAEAIQVLKAMPLSQRQLISQKLQSRLPSSTQQLFTPLFLGLKEKKLELLEKQHLCSYWGISHHMARSGAHLIILLVLLITLLHYVQLPNRYQYLLYGLLLFGYSSISYSTISFLRALWMSLLYAICKICKVIPSSSHILMLTTLCIALCNPMQLFFLDFQLSFGITYIIIWFFNLKNKTTIALFQSNSVRS